MSQILNAWRVGWEVLEMPHEDFAVEEKEHGGETHVIGGWGPKGHHQLLEADVSRNWKTL